MKTVITIIGQIRPMSPMGLMGRMRLMGLLGPMALLRLLVTLSFIICHFSFSVAQIRIGGNVYGGGNKGNVEGNADVRVRAGEINKVFGGARSANVGGRTFVNIDGEHALDDMVISEVYGGNDVAGTIGQSGETTTVPEELKNVRSEKTDEELTALGKTRETYNKTTNVIDNTWKTFVATSRSTKTVDAKTMEDKWITIGSLFGGGNGDFTYTDGEGNPKKDASGNYIVTEQKTINGIKTEITVATSATPFVHPDIDKTYLEIRGGNIAHVYGGGNNATIRENTTINIDNGSDDCQKFVIGEAAKLWTADTDPDKGTIDDFTTEGDHTMRHYMAEVFSSLKEMSGLQTFQTDITSFEFNHARIFGGNNKAAMAIRPTWNLQQGIIRDLYSGGNQGDMNSPEGLLLEIDPVVNDHLSVHNVFGGCRMADVKPLDETGAYKPCSNLPGYHFPNELSARVLIRGGVIDNVYGGNDITGTVYGGNAIGIYSTINGDVYGGGNGAYAYSNQLASKDHVDYADFWYDPEDYSSSIEALNAHRPNAEQVSIRLWGKDAEHPTIIKGSVYVGGNCASLATKKANPMVELKMGSHVIADKVFMGNNGEKLIDPDILTLYGNDDYSSVELTDASNFSDYMLGAAMDLQPSFTFDNVDNGDSENYEPYTSYVGSFYCGGNRGSMIIPRKNIYEIDKGLYIFNKFVGGCNNAYVDEIWTGENETRTQLCTTYEGGILGSAAEQENYTDASGNIKDRLEINLKNLTILPKRWTDENKTELTWNTQKWSDVYVQVEEGTTLTEGQKYYTSDAGAGEFTATAAQTATASTYEKVQDFVPVERDPSDTGIRLMGGNVYGGCYEGGHVNGNVVININEDLMKKDEVFGTDARASGVDLLDQRDDVSSVAMTVFGAGYGEKTEVWGSTTVNLNKGYAFQVFGGGEMGVVGRKRDVLDEHGEVDHQEYYFNPAFSSTVNLNATTPVYSSEETNDDLAESEYLYGGGNEGNVCGNTYVNLGNGRVYDAFGGATDADILGHTEVYIGRQPNGSGGYRDGFPWIKDIVYGGNDFGGTIHGGYEDGYDFTSRVRDYATDKTSLFGSPTNELPGVLKSSSYVEYLQGRVDTIFGGGYGFYDYKVEYAGTELPYLESSFVNIRPNLNGNNHLIAAFGGGTGFPKNRDGDKSQDRSYVLIDIPKSGGKDVEYYKNLRVFGSGGYNGMGMRFDKEATFADAFDPNQLSAVVDLMRGKIKSVYGGSYNEGITARTVINVPNKSTIYIDSIFGGAYGTQILPPCDVYESNVNYCSTDATVTGAIYGGNNNERRTLYAKVNIHTPVWSNKDKKYLATVYGAGHGIDTWSEYTEVNLLDSARVYEVYGGGEMGHVLNAESVQKYMKLYKDSPSPQIGSQDPYWKEHLGDLTSGDAAVRASAVERWTADWKNAWTIGEYYIPNAGYTNYATNGWTNLTNAALVTHDADMDERDFTGYSDEEKAKRQYRYNTNVRIHEGATVVGYAYGGGLGDSKVGLTGDVYGTTYIGLLGGTVVKDMYAAGTTGAVYDLFGVGAYNASTNPNGFTASANAYVKGGSCRNVYGGGWKGNVGAHIDPETHSSTNDITKAPTNDIPGETHVVIGDLAGTSFTSGIPTVQRNAYGGGEGGAVYGTAHLTLNNGYVGYQYNKTSKEYEEKIEDDTKETPNTFLQYAGCMFGGGYIDNSIVDKTYINLYNGHVRGSVFGGGEIAAIGRGSMNKSTVDGKTTYSLAGIYRPGKTNIKMYGGQVHRNVYGGGRGSDNLGGHGSLNCDGYVFGQTEVNIHGGEIGTVSGVADGDGNVFGGGDEGFVYSAYENTDGTFGRGVKTDVRYGGLYQGYYYKHAWDNGGQDEQTESLFVHENGDERVFTEDCKVLIEPHLKVTTAVNINGTAYKAGDYVPIEDLNTLGNKSSDYRWDYLDPAGIIIHNAVFAGGNIPTGSLTTSANTATVFGNATASINDIYHRDMITLGTRHTGGLYGDGNLTLVDGYRELNITNYGTDYYSIAKQIGIDAYHDLPEREADYYELRYKCLKDCQDKDGTQYKAATTDANGFTTKASTITADEMQSLFVTKDGEGNKVSVTSGGIAILKYDETAGEWVPNDAVGANFWEESGVLPVYAGRLMNSIQRADFCGVFGSRMVMQGAQDRVPEEVDYNNYTINRVREVSLNKKNSVITGDAAPFHGNYFGIYNIVNYLGALTSDVDFGDDTNRPYARTTDNTTDDAKYKCTANGRAYGTASFYDWKKEFPTDRRRNNGSSHNKVALASGVYLEITTEESTGTGLYEKVWGPITGVVELDLINVSTGIGGGFVYAKNQHGVRSKTNHQNTTLTALNDNAVTQWDFTYTTEDNTKKEFETSGNFVHSTQTIIDDCYNISNKYTGLDAMPAHYWYIKGSTYVYDQYISAYTGSSNAFSETVDIPLTIAAASHGKMKLLNVQPNLYAYYSSPGVKLADGKKVVINDKTYYKNDPISYWDWYLLSNSEKELFVEETYTNCITCTIDGVKYEAGTYVMTDDEFETYLTTFPAGKTKHEYTDDEGNNIQTAEKTDADDEYIFRPSNNVGHESGYILTYEVNNPSKWDNWYTPKSDATEGGKITLAAYNELSTENKAKYYDGPTYRLDPTQVTGDGILLGQRAYKVGEVIAKSVVDTYTSIPSAAKPNDEEHKQAAFEEGFIVKNKITVTDGSSEYHYNVGATVPKTFADAHSSDVEEAYICTNSVQVTKEEVVYKDTKMTKTEADAYVSDVNGKMNTIKTGASELTLDQIKALPTTGDGAVTAEQKKQLTELATLRDNLKASLVPAYCCTTAGLYGGNYYEKNKNYRGLEAWSSMTEADHGKFVYNYDALDLLIDPTYGLTEGAKYQYDSADKDLAGAQANKAGYSLPQSVDYTATYNGNETTDQEADDTGKKYMEVSQAIIASGRVHVGDELARDVYESLPNEQRHYSPIAVKENGTYYVVNTAFQIGSTPYAVGEVISSETFTSLPNDEQDNVTQLTFTNISEPTTYYYCRDSYTIGQGGHSVTNATNVTAQNGSTHESCTIEGTYNANATVPTGLVIPFTTYSDLTNQQRNFTIHGISPTETSTLFVSRESNIYDLSKEKIITVVYQYDYDETDGSGNVTPISERHVVNIHLTFKSGIPTVADITPPEIILPGDMIALRDPAVTPGAYEVTGGGWELFETQRDAESHSNGVEYDPNNDKLYWYQDGYLISYYAKSYFGRTYSNYVPVSVANYHDLAEVMSEENKAHHMYIDNINVKRDPKIYINDYSGSGKDGLDHFKNLYDLSLRTTPAESGDLQGHALLNDRVKAGQNLEFFLRTDINHPDDPAVADEWTPIASGSDPCFNGTLHGDGHTISGLDNSLFGKLCGSVYNLGVTGSFTSAGVADSGDGYVESCWVKTSSSSSLSGIKAVFGGSPSVSHEQTVNCYYPESNTYATGKAIQKSDRAFYNGEVAYDLNNFYLYKRYSDKRVNSGLAYQYWKSGQTAPQTGYYASHADHCSSGYNGIKYVEERFADGDFRYAAGEIPETEDERHWQETISGSGETAVKEDRWSPIWPDDYIFFGQKLTYGYDTDYSHQNVPTAVVRDGGRLSLNDDANRVYRAPAYFRSKAMGVAHFNPNAYLAQKSSDGTKEVYPFMTAIDFAGHNGSNEYNGTYGLGFTDGKFYTPLLDDDGLTGIVNCDETKNLLVYAPAESAPSDYANKATYDVLTSYFVDPEYDSYYDNTDGYRLVDICQQPVYGHLVKSNLKATNDHLLADKEDFNAPIAYSFDDDHRMWYQRMPANKEFVDRTKGWMGVSIPFSAELVTTHQKGEITHFYSGSETSKNGTGSKIGHEYWLREFRSVATATEGEPAKEVAKATFNYPTAAGSTKTVTNHFLWDYYYEKTDRKDKNSDIYQEYYQNNRNFTSYPLLAAAKPYIIGFPGETYYEFDLSGNFRALNTAATIEKLDKQTITFASNTGIGIAVSDEESSDVERTAEGSSKNYTFTFHSNYLGKSLTASSDYVMKDDGSRFDQVVGDVLAVPFRPYFTATSAAKAGSRRLPDYILFDGDYDSLEGEMESSVNGTLDIYVKDHKIVTTSHLKQATTIHIVSVSGITVANYALQPGETVETPIRVEGAYIVNKKKLLVK